MGRDNRCTVARNHVKSIQLTFDSHLIKAILALDGVYDSLVYDDSPSLVDYEPTGLWFILSEDEDTAGFIHLGHLNNVTWIPHIYIFERYRGNGSEEWGNQVVQWMKASDSGCKFLALTPYKAAAEYAERMGFTNIGVLSSSIRKNGVLLNQYMLEMN